MDEDLQTHYSELGEALKTVLLAEHKEDFDRSFFIKNAVELLIREREATDALLEFSKQANRVLVQDNKIDEGLALLDRISQEFQKRDNSYGLAAIQLEMIPNLLRLGKAEKALKLNDDVIRLTTDHQFGDLLGEAYHSKGVLEHISGNIEEAEHFYLKAYEKIDEAPDYATKNQYLYSLANLYLHYLGEFEQAKEFYQSALDLAQSEEDKMKVSFYYDHIGMAEYWMGNYEESLSAHASSWDILQDRDGGIEKLYHKVSTASTYLKMKNYKASLDDLRSVLDLKKSNTDTYSNSTYLLTLAEIMNESDLDVQDFEGIIEGRLNPTSLAEAARQLGTENKYPPSIINANLLLAKLTFADHPENAILLLSEAKQVAISNNRFRDLKLVQNYVENLGLDFNTI